VVARMFGLLRTICPVNVTVRYYRGFVT